MILPFSTQLNGKPTYFVEKIITGLAFKKLISFDVANEIIEDTLIQKYNKQGELKNFLIKLDRTVIHKPKIHTIREDKKILWTPGTKIDFFINCRQLNMFRFAPVLPVVSTQQFQVTYNGKTRAVYINDMLFYFGEPNESYNENKPSDRRMLKLANNDGFDNIEDFFNYFNEDFTGKIIHWTDLKY